MMEIKQTACTRRQFLKQLAIAGLGLQCLSGLCSHEKRAAADEETCESIVSFDLSKCEKQVYSIERDDGTVEVFGIEPVPATRSSDTQDLGNGYGDWFAFWYSGIINMSFYIRTDNYKITRCYNEWVGVASTSVYSIVIDSDKLTYGSSWCLYRTSYHDSGFGIRESKSIAGTIDYNILTYQYRTYNS